MACATREQHQNHRHDNPALLHTRLHRPDLPQGSRSVHPPGRRCRHVRGLPRELGRRWWWNSWRWRWNSRRRARIRWPGSARAPKYLGIDLVGSERENSGVAARLDDLASQVLDGVVHHLADTKAAGRHRGLGAQADVSHGEVLGLVRPRGTRRQRQQKNKRDPIFHRLSRYRDLRSIGMRNAPEKACKPGSVPGCEPGRRSFL